MKIAITTWENRISPVFDTSRHLRIVELSNNGINSHIENIASNMPYGKTECIKQLGIDVLICGAITKKLYTDIINAGIKIVPFVCGNVDDVLNEYLNKDSLDGKFLMPGCRKI
ncbi:NifB/NifX family molybdenum-iron cluster-binding protein [bacterium]|nr:NifB/NifX family molybdenum-iron cluster-binding protein [bacterium]